MMPPASRNSFGAPRHEQLHRMPDYRPEGGATATRPAPDESGQDIRSWPGLILTALGIISVALTLTIAGYGFIGWAVVCAAAAVAFLGIGITLLVAEHHRARRPDDGQE